MAYRDRSVAAESMRRHVAEAGGDASEDDIGRGRSRVHHAVAVNDVRNGGT